MTNTLKNLKTRRSLTESSASSLTRPQASEQYLLCAQLVLRKQLKWLVDVQKLPGGLEVRPFWSCLKLSS